MDYAATRCNYWNDLQMTLVRVPRSIIHRTPLTLANTTELYCFWRRRVSSNPSVMKYSRKMYSMGHISIHQATNGSANTNGHGPTYVANIS